MSTKLMLLLACLAGFSACSPEQSNDRETVDILILNGTVYDGSLEPPKQTNIAVTGDRIVSMDASSELNAKLVIDAADLVVTPDLSIRIPTYWMTFWTMSLRKI